MVVGRSRLTRFKVAIIELRPRGIPNEMSVVMAHLTSEHPPSATSILQAVRKEIDKAATPMPAAPGGTDAVAGAAAAATTAASAAAATAAMSAGTKG